MPMECREVYIAEIAWHGAANTRFKKKGLQEILMLFIDQGPFRKTSDREPRVSATLSVVSYYTPAFGRVGVSQQGRSGLVVVALGEPPPRHSREVHPVFALCLLNVC